jgi:hypothetical protein
VSCGFALGVTEALLNEALWLLTFPGDKRIMYPTPGRVALGPDWRGRCEGQAAAGVREDIEPSLPKGSPSGCHRWLLHVRVT